MDCVLIDTAYDDQVFNVVLSDVPEKKNDFVAGEYEIALPQKPPTVGVKIIDNPSCGSQFPDRAISPFWVIQFTDYSKIA